MLTSKVSSCLKDVSPTKNQMQLQGLCACVSYLGDWHSSLAQVHQHPLVLPAVAAGLGRAALLAGWSWGGHGSFHHFIHRREFLVLASSGWEAVFWSRKEGGFSVLVRSRREGGLRNRREGGLQLVLASSRREGRLGVHLCRESWLDSRSLVGEGSSRSRNRVRWRVGVHLELTQPQLEARVGEGGDPGHALLLADGEGHRQVAPAQPGHLGQAPLHKGHPPAQVQLGAGLLQLLSLPGHLLLQPPDLLLVLPRNSLQLVGPLAVAQVEL